MLSLFRKRKTKGSGKRNVAQERVASSIVSACIRLQQRWANFMQRHTERLSRNGKLILLSLFCLTAGSISIYFIANSLLSRKASSFTVAPLTKPPYANKSGDENTKAFVIISKAEYEKIQRFRFYMDSLARSPSSKKVHDSILTNRPGLMDSILLLETIYQSQNKK
ncbi:hypothetical protein SAMN05444410_101318 [Hydrobacter penzbergensis]|uniref:Uncharacterized protein n=1 Tax=Hydrobacter penzbergensis TaxID=1235997 RepID=A0A8X8ICN5_9BACT|nr:hypothetical protein [Hydrobacter penzbergensis]SDW13656.1 hypothetical protein SAMN05444410_101318 [Hydrobacter penzbergensis]